MAKFYVSSKIISTNNPNNNQFIQGLMKDPGAASALSSSASKAELLRAVQKTSGGGSLDRNKLSQAFGALQANSKHFSKKTLDRITQAALPGCKYTERYSSVSATPNDVSKNVTSSASMSSRRPLYAGISRPINVARPMPAAPIKSIPIKGLSGLSGKVGFTSAKSSLPGMARAA